MKTLIAAIVTIFPLIGSAESVYKCKTADDLTVYSDYPCKAVAQKPITVKENTIDQSQLRKSAGYANALPKPVDNSPTAPNVSAMPTTKSDNATDRSSIRDQTTNSATSNPGNQGAAAVTTQPWQ